MAMLRERLQPIAQAAPDQTSPGREADLLWMRYGDLVRRGFSPETSMIVAEARVALDTVTSLLLPDLR